MRRKKAVFGPLPKKCATRSGSSITGTCRCYPRSTEGPGSYIVVAQNGTLVDTFGSQRSLTKTPCGVLSENQKLDSVGRILKKH